MRALGAGARERQQPAGSAVRAVESVQAATTPGKASGTSVTSTAATPHNYKDETVKHVSRYQLLKKINEGDWDGAGTILYNDDMFARIPDLEGNLPLHLSVKLGCTSYFLQLLLTAYPESVRLKDSHNLLPLHLAVCHPKARLWIDTKDMVAALYTGYPQAAVEKDPQGNLPLHLALRHQGPDEMIRFLLQMSPETVQVRDARDNLPLHLAVQFGAGYMIIFELLKLYPAAAAVANINGSYPLHRVALVNASLDILEAVLAAYPEAAAKRDKHGNLPIHLAYLIAGGPPDETKLRLWITAYPAGLSIKNNNGSTPLTMFNRPQENLVDDYI